MSVSPDIYSSSCGDQAREQGDKAVNKDKGKNHVVTITGFKDLNKEFAECINNSSNRVSAANPSVSAAGIDFTNSTNDFSAAGLSVFAARLDSQTAQMILVLLVLQMLLCQTWKIFLMIQMIPGVWQEELEIKVEYHRCSMKTFIPACLPAFCHKRSPKESIKLSRIQVRLKPCKKSSFSSRCRKFGSWWIYPMEKGQLQLAAATYSASVDEVASTVYFLHCQKINLHPRN
nr:hypothetical protein [Tanacetum cinerariifolium]